MKTAKPVCTECGLCCIALYDQSEFCDLVEEDMKRLPKQYRRHIHHARPFNQLIAILDGHNEPSAALATRKLVPRSGPLKNFHLCACVLLRGNPLKKTWCAVYPLRPIVCHEAVKPGDATCRWTRNQIQEALEEDKRNGDDSHGQGK